jgi:RTX calcium-binding nonapeptide repeat (4 copies)/Calpain family cysteine protease
MKLKQRSAKLTLDRLEDRSLPATGITLTVVNGVLRLTGSDGNDAVLIRQTAANAVTVAYGTTTRSFTGVNSIYADGGAGDDYLYFDTTPLGANEIRLAMKATLLGGAGNDTLVGGANNDYLDGGIGNDSLFGNAGNDTIYGGDGNDLVNAGVGDDSVHGGTGDDKIYGSTGNDLLEGDSGQDYIDGGAGSDNLQGGTGFDTFKSVFPGVDVLDQSDPEDVRQGLSGTCVILASLQAVTNSGVDLSAKVRQISANYYSVPIYRPGTGWVNQVVFFDGTWTDNDPTPTADGAAWPLLYQRAFLQEMGVNWADPDSANWATKYGNRFQNVDSGLVALTGKANYFGSRPGGSLLDSDLTAMRAALTSKRPEIALTRPTGTMTADLNRLGLIPSHAYAIVGFGVKNGQTTIRLRNPWGTDGPVTFGANDGIIEIAWSDFRRVFLGVCIS